jgi:hypothetical protein
MLGLVPQPNLGIKAFFLKGEGIVDLMRDRPPTLFGTVNKRDSLNRK